MEKAKMVRVNRENPCPVCEKPDWCLLAADGSAAICQRIEAGSVKHCGQAGWLHKLTEPWAPTQTQATSVSVGQPGKKRLLKCYDYRDYDGELLYQVCRYEPKSFRQRRPDGKGGWLWNLHDTERVLYRLSGLAAADKATDTTVFICEGEKDVDRLAGLGLTATTNSGGASKWHTLRDVEVLAGRKVAILPDNDRIGQAHAEQIAASLCGECEVKIVQLPGLAEKGDVSDWLDDGGSRDGLLALVGQTPLYGPIDEYNAVDGHSRSFVRFPLEVLPGCLAECVAVMAEAIGCDVSYVALPLLAGLAAAIGNSRRVKLKEGWCEPSVVWTAIVGESGTMKSPALEIPLRGVFDKQAAAMGQYEHAMTDYQQQLHTHKLDLAEWKRKGRKTGEPQPEAPQSPSCERYCCMDTTVEALADRLSDSPRGLLLVRDELAGWLGSFNQYKGGVGGDVAYWLSMHGAKPLQVDRKTGEKTAIFVPSAAVCITGGIQPDILRRALGDEYFENGLAARLLLAMPPQQTRQWSEQTIDRQLQDGLAELFNRLYSLEGRYSDNGHLLPVDVPLDAPAKQSFVEFFNAHNAEKDTLSGPEAAAWSKLEGYAGRLALVIHFVRWAGGDEQLSEPTTIDADSIAAGITLARWFGNETRRVYAVLNEDQQQRWLRKAIEKIIKLGGEVSVRDWARRHNRQTVDEAKVELERLVEAGMGSWQEHVIGGRSYSRLVLHGHVMAQ